MKRPCLWRCTLVAKVQGLLISSAEYRDPKNHYLVEHPTHNKHSRECRRVQLLRTSNCRAPDFPLSHLPTGSRAPGSVRPTVLRGPGAAGAAGGQKQSVEPRATTGKSEGVTVSNQGVPANHPAVLLNQPASVPVNQPENNPKEAEPIIIVD